MNELQDFEYLKFQHHKENLHDVFGTVLNTFPHINGATVTGQAYLWDVLQKIKYNLTSDIDPNTYLLNKYVNGTRNTAYDQRKEQLPAICYNARFNGYKDTKHLNSVTNLMFLDIDDFPSKQEALDYKKLIIAKYSWIVACNLSLSRLGLHVIALVDNITDSTDYTNKYKYISSAYFENRLDKDSNKLTQYAVLPSDYDIYINQYPEILPIEQIYSEHIKGIRSVYIQDTNLSHSSIGEKGISSAHNININSSIGIEKEKGILSAHKGGEIIYTPYTFLSNSYLNNLMNDTARNYRLRFKLEVDEDYFKDPNIPIYYREGIDIIDVRLYHLRDKKIYEGNRHNFIGAITIKLLYLNVGSPENYDQQIRADILKFILHINKRICAPPLTFNEILKSYNANWRRYRKGEIDFSKYFRKQRAFWSKHSTLSANEKRSVTSKIKNAPTVENSKRKIWEAMEHLCANKEKITQEKVATLSGLKLPTVKKYRNEYREFKEMLSGGTGILEIDGNISTTSEERNVNALNQEIAISDCMNHSIENDYFELETIEKVEFVEDKVIQISGTAETDFKAEYKEDQLQMLYRRLFNSSHVKFDDNTNAILYEWFLNYFRQLPADDGKLLITPPENISDSDAFWRQSSLESKIRELCTEVLSDRHS